MKVFITNFKKFVKTKLGIFGLGADPVKPQHEPHTDSIEKARVLRIKRGQELTGLGRNLAIGVKGKTGAGFFGPVPIMISLLRLFVELGQPKRGFLDLSS